MRNRSFLILTGFWAVVGLACGGNAENPPTPVLDRAAQAAAPALEIPTPQTASAMPASPGTVAGVTWTAPTGWIAQPERPMRVATYMIPASDGDAEAGECAVFFFGAGQGGSVDLNLARWRDQFEGPDGKPAALNQKASTINGLKVTMVSVAGTYLASMGPMFQSGQASKPGFKMLGAIIAAPEGNVFVKLTGPVKTIDGAEKAFTEMLNSVKK